MVSTIKRSLGISLFIAFTILFQTNILTAEVSFFDQKDCSKKEETCFGKRVWKSGQIYEGEFKYGKMTGYGKMLWKDGSSYEGQFDDGIRHGEGTQFNTDGSIYKGQWVDGWMQGEGVYSFACGHQYMGSFFKDKMDGEGTITYADGSAYTGQWSNGKPNGTGKFQRVDGSVFSGSFDASLREGKGQINWENIGDFEGTWKKNKLNGNTTFTFANGDKMTCVWTKGVLVRESCVYTFKDGTVKRMSLDQLCSIKKINENLAWVLYFDAQEQIVTKNLTAANTKLVVAKRLVKPNHAIFPFIAKK